MVKANDYDGQRPVKKESWQLSLEKPIDVESRMNVLRGDVREVP
jgi:hypothetical protein